MRSNYSGFRLGGGISLRAVVAGGVLMLLAAPGARAGILDVPTLSVVGGVGIPGGTVDVTFSLSNDPQMMACATGMDFNFDNDVLMFPGMFAPQGCTLAPRIAATHQIQGPLFPPGNVLDIEIFGNLQNFPLGDGVLTTCLFSVLPGVPVGTTDVTIENAFLTDCAGNDISPIDVVNGVVVIANPTPTPTVTATNTVQRTPTNTPFFPTATNTIPTVIDTPTATPTAQGTATNTVPITVTATVTNTVPTIITATVTHTPVVTATNTVGVSPTATRTSATATPTRKKADDDGCSVVPTDRASANGALVLFLAPALLLWARRRRG